MPLTLKLLEELKEKAKKQPWGLEDDYDASANGNYDDTFQDGYEAGQVQLAREISPLLAAATWALEKGYKEE